MGYCCCWSHVKVSHSGGSWITQWITQMLFALFCSMQFTPTCAKKLEWEGKMLSEQCNCSSKLREKCHNFGFVCSLRFSHWVFRALLVSGPQWQILLKQAQLRLSQHTASVFSAESVTNKVKCLWRLCLCVSVSECYNMQLLEKTKQNQMCAFPHMAQ